jgi:hypothetical protein
MDQSGELFGGDLVIQLVFDKINDPKGQLNQIDKGLVLLDLYFALQQFFWHLVIIIIILIIVIILPQVSTNLLIHKVKMLDLLAAGA